MKALSKKPVDRSSHRGDSLPHSYLADHPDARIQWSMNEVVFGRLIAAKKERIKRRKREKVLFFSIGLCISLLLVIAAFDWKIYTNIDDAAWKKEADHFENLVEIPQTEQVVPLVPKVDQAHFIEIADEEIIEEQIELNLDLEITEEAAIQQVIVSVPELVEVEEKAEEIFTIVEQQPSPVGGMAAFYKYVGDNLKYPDMASRMNIQGRVFVQFVIEKDGSITDVQVVKGIGAGCDEEAVRVVSQAPAWEPGKQRGRPVRVRMILPIVFRLIS